MTFSRDLRDFTGFVTDQVHRLAFHRAGRIFQGVVSISPVDTGYFRANWNLSWSVPDLSQIDVEGPNPVPIFDLPSSPPFDFAEIHITNNTVYGERLNDGTSPQAPAGILDPVMAAVDAIQD